MPVRKYGLLDNMTTFVSSVIFLFFLMSRRVFIVENEFIIAEDLSMIVKQLGYQSTGYARSLAEAQQQITAEPPELVLLDVQLSDQMDGLEVARWLQKQQIAFLFVTSYTDPRTRQRTDATAPLGYLTKPFDQKDVQEALRAAFVTIDRRL